MLGLPDFQAFLPSPRQDMHSPLWESEELKPSENKLFSFKRNDKCCWKFSIMSNSIITSIHTTSFYVYSFSLLVANYCRKKVLTHIFFIRYRTI